LCIDTKFSLNVVRRSSPVTLFPANDEAAEPPIVINKSPIDPDGEPTILEVPLNNTNNMTEDRIAEITGQVGLSANRYATDPASKNGTVLE
jgi:hypothetical protein